MMARSYGLRPESKMGKAIRAVSEDKKRLPSWEIGIDAVIVTTFVIAGISAGRRECLCRDVQAVHSSWAHPGIKAFTAAVLEGSEISPGRMLGGIFLGLVESVAPACS